MGSPPSSAAFTVSGAPVTAGAGFDAASGQVLQLQLAASPALDVTSCVYSVFSSSPGAPAPVFANGGVASPPTAPVALTLPTFQGAHTWSIQCQTNDGAAVNGDYSINTKRGVVAVRNGLGLRKMFVGESVEYSNTGWVQVVDDLVDAGGNGGKSIQPQVTTFGDQVANLLASPVTIGTRQSVKSRYYFRAAIFGQTTVAVFEQVIEATGTRLAGNILGGWRAIQTDESNVAGAFTGFGPSPGNVTGAANSSGQVSLAYSSSGLIAGQSIVDVAGVTGIAGVNGPWVVDSIPDGGHIVLRGPVWNGGYTGGGTVTPLGTISFAVNPTNVQVQAMGLRGAPWAQGESVLLWTLRTTASGLYLCTTAGTTSNSGSGPTGSGSGIVDGSAVWEWLSGGPFATVIWQAAYDPPLVIQG